MSFYALCLTLALQGANEEYTVLPASPGGSSSESMMLDYLNGLIDTALERRAEAFEHRKTQAEWRAYQEDMRAFFIDALGGFPERTPLNPQIVESRTLDDYRIEKVIIESRPDFHVPAVMFLPLSDPPYPGVLVPCGHSTNGKACSLYQQACSLLARNGIAALCYDPIDQGERGQILDDQGNHTVGGTFGHTHTGVGAILVGSNTATYRIWDGMRCLDYLVGRDDIDPERIGCTGNSGGGTLTSFLMALDPRIKCAAPSCYLTSFQQICRTIGPQDSEQNIYRQIAAGMDHADYVMMRAPKPTLMCCATHDFFAIEGTWDTFRQAKRCYTLLGYSERVDLVEADAKHGFSTLLRQAMVRWMRRWLLDTDDAVVEDPDYPVLTDEEMQCTPRGQVLLMDGEKSVYQLNAERAEALAEQRRAFWAETPREEALNAVRDITGIRPLAAIPEPESEVLDTIDRDGYRIEKAILRPEPGIVLPALHFLPAQPTGETYLYVHGEGKHVDAGPNGPIQRLVAEGHPVFAVDLRGIGETQAETAGVGESWDQTFGSEWKNFYRAYLLGKSYLGMRAEDILVCARYLKRPSGVHLVAIGETAPPALHAAALEPNLFASVRLEQALRSWVDVVNTPEAQNQLINTVHGALEVYDLPDLAACVHDTLPDGFHQTPASLMP